ncbi:BlaI/MecI/CopY family transcriptional regulator [Schlesneria paludicola]|uniref:BlaI/MecI/CopY family transcriptional regulator n=1 Tax=Schlesneria paludicola TaxID=360056 RepID=UPI00029A34F0|nr:BlaI/MecI/CopY family transcriptional regulator [Schlesneria paludicola]
MATSPKLPALTEPQLEIMQVVWQHEEITVSDVWQAISAKRPVARNTILTVLDRLEKRGWLQKRSVGNVQLYRACVSEKVTLTQAVQRLVNTFFGGSSESLMMTLLEGRGISPQEAQRIRQQIETARGKKS